MTSSSVGLVIRASAVEVLELGGNRLAHGRQRHGIALEDARP